MKTNFLHATEISLALLIALGAGKTLGADASTPGTDVVTPANVVVELSLKAARAHADPFNDITLDALFTDPAGTTRRVPAFWAGKNMWKVRYASGLEGVHHFTTDCSDPGDPGLQGVQGTVHVVPYQGDNALYRHGPLRVADDHRHLAYADGSPFLWLGDTWWMGLCDRLKWPDEFATLTADRKAKGFDVIQIVVGLYPDQKPFDEHSKNEAGFPWEKDYSHIRPEYFDAADRRIEYLVDQGFVPCIVGAWGFHLGFLGEGKMEQHLRYVVARWGAYPVVFCACGEVNMAYYLKPIWPQPDNQQVAAWKPVISYLRSINVFGRLITAHPTNVPPHSSRALLPGLLDFDMLQTGHGNREVLPDTIGTLRAACAAQPPMPVVNAEVSYEGFGPITAASARLMCWADLLSGAAGQTYGANGVWPLHRDNDPAGPSPRRDGKGERFGTIPWEKGMLLPGSQQVGFAAKLLKQLGFEKFTPHLEWARWTVPTPDKYFVPYSAGIPGKVRVIYVPAPGAVTLSDLESGVAYRVTRFDPVSGQASAATLPPPDDNHAVGMDPPPGCDHDWVLVLDGAHGGPLL